MNSMSDNWFIEKENKELTFGYAVKEKLYAGMSEYQKIDVFETKAYGRMLVIDDYVMLTDMDEFVYHEMIAHVPVCYHHNPKSVLVIGGGDGGTVRELIKYEEINEIVLCEIDQLVIDVSKQFFPKLASSLSHPKVKVKVADGIQYISQCSNKFDIIIVDSTDPIGPGEVLFTSEFYNSVRKALKPRGHMVLQSESPWYSQSILRKIYNNVAQSFPVLKPYVGSVPTYPRGLWSWTMASVEENNFEVCYSKRFMNVQDQLNYLTCSRLKNIFDIPPFYKKKLETII